MIFEYTSGYDLHEYLHQRSPQSDIDPGRNCSASEKSILEPSDFIRIGIQVSEDSYNYHLCVKLPKYVVSRDDNIGLHASFTLHLGKC